MSLIIELVLCPSEWSATSGFNFSLASLYV